MIPLSLTSTLFPYTTLFRSRVQDGGVPAALLRRGRVRGGGDAGDGVPRVHAEDGGVRGADQAAVRDRRVELRRAAEDREDRKSTRLNSSHGYISYAVFCLKK